MTQYVQYLIYSPNEIKLTNKILICFNFISYYKTKRIEN